MSEILERIAGAGWLVLSGGADAGGELRSLALQKAKLVGGVAYPGFNEDSADEVLDDMEDLGAPTGYLVNLIAEDDDTIQGLLRESSIIVLEDSVAAETWRDGLTGAGADGMQGALEQGAVVLAEGSGAAVLGEYFLTERGNLNAGFGWLSHALILPGVTSLSDSEVARELLEAEPRGVVIGIGHGSALALGGAGEVEVWGEKRVVIAPGRAYQQPGASANGTE